MEIRVKDKCFKDLTFDEKVSIIEARREFQEHFSDASYDEYRKFQKELRNKETSKRNRIKMHTQKILELRNNNG